MGTFFYFKINVCSKTSTSLDAGLLCFAFSGKLGALRLKVRLVEDRILPSMYYQPLIDLLVESVISPTEVSIAARPHHGYSLSHHHHHLKRLHDALHILHLHTDILST